MRGPSRATRCRRPGPGRIKAGSREVKGPRLSLGGLDWVRAHDDPRRKVVESLGPRDLRTVVLPGSLMEPPRAAAYTHMLSEPITPR